jgi:three-Cys-motif partner protein
MPVHIILVEQDKRAFGALEKFAADSTTAGFSIHPICGEFVLSIPEINRVVRKYTTNPFRFVFLDPKGWADIPMKALQPFLRDRSCEVLINLMTRHIIRFLDEENRAESYEKLFGRPGVLSSLRKVPKGAERTEQAVREYCRSLQDLCGFSYVSSAVIFEPDQESIRYFLVYGTNHSRGIEVFKEAETLTSHTQDLVRHGARALTSGQDEWDFGADSVKSRLTYKLRERYANRARGKVLESLRRSGSIGVSYSALFCEAMAFPLVTPTDLQSWIEALGPCVRLQLAGSSQRKRPSPAQDDRVVVMNYAKLL